MIIAEWSGRKVTLYTDTKIQFRQINVPHNVVGVQVSGDSRTDAMVSIAMDMAVPGSTSRAALWSASRIQRQRTRER